MARFTLQGISEHEHGSLGATNATGTYARTCRHPNPQKRRHGPTHISPRQATRPICAKVLGPTNATLPKQQTNETVAAQPLKVYAAHAKQRGLLAPQQKGLFAAHVGVKLFLTN